MALWKRLIVVSALLVLSVFALAGCGKLTLRVTVDLAEGGTVTLDPPGGQYDRNTLVTAHIAVNSGYVFTGWEGDVPTGHELDLDLQVLMDRNKSIKAVIKRLYGLTITCDPDEGGAVHTEILRAMSFPEGTVVRLTAEPSADYAFEGWGGDASGTSTTYDLTIEGGNKNVVAHFAPLTPTAPAGLTAVGSLHKISLHWSPSIGHNLLGYNVYRSDGSGYVQRNTTLITGIDFEDAVESPAGDGVQYMYCVYAVSDTATSNPAKVSAMHGTRLTGAAGSFTTSSAESPYVIEGTANFGGDLTVFNDTKLYVLPGSRLNFTATTAPSRLAVNGLLRMIGTGGSPITIDGDSSKGFYMIFDGATAYGTGDGTALEYVSLSHLGRTSYFPGITVSDCSPRFHDVVLQSKASEGLYREFEMHSGAIVDHCSFDGMSLSIYGDLRSTPFSVTYSTFGDYYAVFLCNSNNPHFDDGDVSNNSFNCAGLGTDIYMYNNIGEGWTTGSGSIYLDGNFWHIGGVKVTPAPSLDKLGAPGFDVFLTPVLDSAPVGVGAVWEI